jgi:TetR/AcrR family transcriptional repressor of nem operon
MRKSRAETAETRERIVEAASAEFRRNGIGATGLAGLMGAAGLTHGGFYKHFESKDQVVAEACTRSIEQIADSLGKAMASHRGPNRLHGAVNGYLSSSHRDHPDSGCPFAALGPELARGGETVRDSATAGIERMIALIAGPDADAAARQDAMVALSAMVGALTLSRIADGQLSKDLLKQVRQHLLDTLPSSGR